MNIKYYIFNDGTQLDLDAYDTRAEAEIVAEDMILSRGYRYLEVVAEDENGNHVEGE